MSERNGKEQTRTLGQQKKGEFKKAWGPGKGEKKNKSPPRLVRDCNWGHTNGWPQNRKIGWCVGGCRVSPALLQAL